MSVEQMIREAVAVLNIPVYPRVYTGELKEYAVFNYAEYGRVVAENKPTASVYSCQLHWFLPLKKNPRSGKNAIRSALAARGCTWPSIIDAGDSESQHYVFEFEYAGAVNG